MKFKKKSKKVVKNIILCRNFNNKGENKKIFIFKNLEFCRYNSVELILFIIILNSGIIKSPTLPAKLF